MVCRPWDMLIPSSRCRSFALVQIDLAEEWRHRFVGEGILVRGLINPLPGLAESALFASFGAPSAKWNLLKVMVLSEVGLAHPAPIISSIATNIDRSIPPSPNTQVPQIPANHNDRGNNQAGLHRLRRWGNGAIGSDSPPHDLHREVESLGDNFLEFVFIRAITIRLDRDIDIAHPPLAIDLAKPGAINRTVDSTVVLQQAAGEQREHETSLVVWVFPFDGVGGAFEARVAAHFANQFDWVEGGCAQRDILEVTSLRYVGVQVRTDSFLIAHHVAKGASGFLFRHVV